MNGQSIDLRSLGRPPLYQPSSSTPRTPFHDDESFLLPVTPPLQSPDSLSKKTAKFRTVAFPPKHFLDGPPKRSHSSRAVSFAPSTTMQTYPDGPSSPWLKHSRSRRWSRPTWHPSYSMYICFLFGFLCATGHHIFYASLDGKPAGGESQLKMLRYGTILAYAAKSAFSAAVISAFKQRTWLTVRHRFLSIGALDSIFAAAENVGAMFNFEFLREAKGAFALAFFAWTTPLVVILTANTLLVEPKTMVYDTMCPNVRSLNFTFEETYDWRNPDFVARAAELPLSLWNTTKRDDDSDPNWFDYYTGATPMLQQTATLAAFLEEVVPRRNSSIDICGAGWNCTFVIEFMGPGYKCTEIASGAGSNSTALVQESGEIFPPFDTDILLPQGNYSYYAHTSGGEYSTTQLKDTGLEGIPNMPPPYPDHFGALRTEPVIFVGYVVVNNPNETQPVSRDDAGWNKAYTPKILACEHRETLYKANFTYTGETQTAKAFSTKAYGPPIINTTYVPDEMAMDGTDDNTTAVPESNYIYPNNTALYRRVGAYHSLGYMLRYFINGTVKIPDTPESQPFENTPAIQTKILDPNNNYFAYADIESRIQSLYDDIILSMFSNPLFTAIVWAAEPSSQTGTLSTSTLDPANDTAYLFPCQKFRTVNAYSYQTRDLWIVYTIAAALTLVCVAAGALAIRDNGGVTRNTRFSSIVAATRGPALDRIAWRGPLQDRGDVPAEVKTLRLGYGVMVPGRDGGGKLAAMGLGLDPNLVVRDEEDEEPAAGAGGGWRGRSGYNSGYVGEMMCGFGMKQDVDQRHREGSLFHR